MRKWVINGFAVAGFILVSVIGSVVIWLWNDNRRLEKMLCYPDAECVYEDEQ